MDIFAFCAQFHKRNGGQEKKRFVVRPKNWAQKMNKAVSYRSPTVLYCTVLLQYTIAGKNTPNESLLLSRWFRSCWRNLRLGGRVPEMAKMVKGGKRLKNGGMIRQRGNDEGDVDVIFICR